MADMVAGEELFILDVRPAGIYDGRRIQGAVNIPWGDLGHPENIALLPTDGTRIVVVCFKGLAAAQISSVLNLLGYNAQSLVGGMMSWLAANAD